MKSWSTISGYRVKRILSGRSNVFLLTDGKSCIMVDSGPGFGWKILQRRLHKLGIDKIDLLILTHSHFDHSANARRIKERYLSRVLIHESEAMYLKTGDNILPSGTNRLTGFLTRHFARRFVSFAKYEPCIPDILTGNYFDLSEFGFNAYVISTPGHTPGSISLIIDDEIALVGDTMFGVFSRSAFPPFADNTDQMTDSWKKLLETHCRIFLPSHGSENSRSLVENDLNRRNRL